MEHLLRDTLFFFRLLKRERRAMVSTAALLSLGVSLFTASLSMVRGVLLRPFPYTSAESLLMVEEAHEAGGGSRVTVREANFHDWRSSNAVFEDMAVFVSWAPHLRLGEQVIPLNGVAISSNLFTLLGVRPVLGQLISKEDERLRKKVVLISSRLWRSHWGARPDIVGQEIRLQQLSGLWVSHTIVGVLPERVRFPEWYGRDGPDIWGTLLLDETTATRKGHSLSVIARLKPGTSLLSAKTEMDGIAQRLAKMYPSTNQNWGISLLPFEEEALGGVRQNLLLVLASSAILLLIASGNAGSLVAAHTISRSREFSMRMALGATPARLAQQVLTEGLLLWGMSGAMGLLLAKWMLTFIPGTLGVLGVPRSYEVSLDAAVAGWALATTMIAGVGSSLWPAVYAMGSSLRAGINQESVWADRCRGSLLRDGFVISQLAFAFVLLMIAGLLLRGFQRMVGIDLGYAPENVQVAKVALPNLKYAFPQRRIDFYNSIVQQIRRIPGVEEIAATDSPPYAPGSVFEFSEVGKGPYPPEAVSRTFGIRFVTPSYFRALRSPLLDGNGFDERATGRQMRAVIVNEEVTRRYWPSENPIGKKIIIRYMGREPYEVIGTTQNARRYGMGNSDEPEAFLSLIEFPTNRVFFFVRATNRRILEDISLAIRRTDGDVELTTLSPLSDLLADSVSRPRTLALLVTFLAATGLALAAFGLCSLIAYGVSQRTREIGIRIAMGARHQDVVILILGRTAAILLIGCALGAALSWGARRLLPGAVSGILPLDPLSFVTVSVVLIAVGITAGLIPAWQAGQADPMMSLRR